jgi:hypothetical protein|tara:strand:- start:13 stop:633 length:621 start_codon:yes stop_codon:yes gene_type:complete
MRDKEKQKAYNKEYYQKNKEEIKASTKMYAEGNPDMVREYRKEYYKKNKEKMDKNTKAYYEANKEKANKNRAIYYEANKEGIAKWRAEYDRERKLIDPLYRLTRSLRGRLAKAVKAGTGKKCGSTLELTGCSWSDLKSHLESQFTEGMTWDNHGYYGWHIDHIRPCASFDLTLDTEQRKCFHYTNLQPLWAEDNLKKGDTYEEPKQ